MNNLLLYPAKHSTSVARENILDAYAVAWTSMLTITAPFHSMCACPISVHHTSKACVCSKQCHPSTTACVTQAADTHEQCMPWSQLFRFTGCWNAVAHVFVWPASCFFVPLAYNRAVLCAVETFQASTNHVLVLGTDGVGLSIASVKPHDVV